MSDVKRSPDDISKDIVNRTDTLDKFIERTQPIGSTKKAISNQLYGYNHQGIKGIIPENRDTYGLAFFTRPQLNLGNDNLEHIRRMYSLLSKNEYSIQRYVRCLLDPRMIDDNIKSLLLDNKAAFIPLFTNNIKSMSGWPDEVLPVYKSKQGVRREQWSHGDGNVEIYEAFDLDCTFKNTKDEPIILLLQTWIRYISYVFEGLMMPYSDFLAEDEMDYNTRIYRLVLDESKRFVKKISATGASFPINVPTGKMFDLNTDTKYNLSNTDINVRFDCNGAQYNDDILILEFNKTSAIFNVDVRLMLQGKSHNLVKIPPSLLDIFNYRGYPIINHNTFELEWWINKDSDTYKDVIKLYK